MKSPNVVPSYTGCLEEEGQESSSPPISLGRVGIAP